MKAARGQYAGATANRCFCSSRMYSPSVMPQRLVKNQLARNTRRLSAAPDRTPADPTFTSVLLTFRGLEPIRPLRVAQPRYIVPLMGERSRIPGSGSQYRKLPTRWLLRIAVDAHCTFRLEWRYRHIYSVQRPRQSLSTCLEI